MITAVVYMAVENPVTGRILYFPHVVKVRDEEHLLEVRRAIAERYKRRGAK